MMNGERGEGWELMEGEGVLTDGREGVPLRHCRLCVCSHHPVRGHLLCMGGTSLLSKGCTSSSMGGGCQLWAGLLFVGAGLSIVAGGARSRGQGV